MEKDRFEYGDQRYNNEKNNRWNTDSEDRSFDGRHLHERSDSHHDLPPFAAEPEIKDFFYRFAFFAELKWLLLLFVAMIGLKHAKKQVSNNNKRP